MSKDTLELLLKRRSSKAAMLAEPGPNPQQLDTILTAAGPRARPQEAGAVALHRVRRRRARHIRPRALKACLAEEKETPSAARLETERTRLLRARPWSRRRLAHTPNPAAPGMGADPLMRRRLLQPVPGRQRAGLRHMLDHRMVFLQPRVRTALKLAANERMAGFVYIGTAKEAAARPRPARSSPRSSRRWTG